MATIHCPRFFKHKNQDVSYIHLISYSDAVAYADQGQREVRLSIGSNEDADITISDDSELKKDHLHIYFGILSPYMLVVDLGGGTWINGKPLMQGKKNKMKPGDRLTCGPFGMTEYTVFWLSIAYETGDSDVEKDLSREIAQSEADEFEGLTSLFPDASESDLYEDLYEAENSKGLKSLSADASDEDRRNDNEAEDLEGLRALFPDAPSL